MSKRQHESGAEKRKKKKIRDDARASIAGESVFYRFNCFANIAHSLANVSSLIVLLILLIAKLTSLSYI